MSSYIPEKLRREVIERAENCCEYCQLSQKGQAATFHIDHIQPTKSGGTTKIDNLALACVSCSLYKAAKEMIADPKSGDIVPVFNPRQNAWHEHFRWSGVFLEGLSKTGRATISTLKMNRPLILAIREEENLLGRHP